jgi:TIR domain
VTGCAYGFDAWAILAEGSVNTIFCAPFEFHFSALTSNDFEKYVQIAAAFITRVREQFPDIAFVLFFGSVDHRDRFFAIAGDRFAHYLSMVSGSVEKESPEILHKCQVWLSRRTASKASIRKVFMCHSSGDKNIVRQLCEKLKGDGIHPWLEETEILPGQEWETEIRKAVRASDIIIVCLS